MIHAACRVGGDDLTGGLGVATTATPTATAESLRALPDHEAGVEAEGLFASMMLQEMRKSLPDGSFFGKGAGADVYDGMLEQFLGRELARQGGFGIAPMIEAQLKSDAAAREATKAAAAAAAATGTTAGQAPITNKTQELHP